MLKLFFVLGMAVLMVVLISKAYLKLTRKSVEKKKTTLDILNSLVEQNNKITIALEKIADRVDKVEKVGKEEKSTDKKQK